MPNKSIAVLAFILFITGIRHVTIPIITITIIISISVMILLSFIDTVYYIEKLRTVYLKLYKPKL